MATVNINREVTDQFYRYKMPKILAKVEGKGNGIKTVIVNMTEVAKALHRPPEYPCKYFGCELGAQTQFDYKNDRYIVNGSHDVVRLQDLLDGFIKRFVLCPECDNPETNLAVMQRKGMIHQRCIACGHQCDIDMRHKLTTYILKNPPKEDQTLSTQGTTPGKKGKDKKGKGGSRTAGGNSPDAGQGDNDIQTNGQHSPTVAEDEDDVDWGEDISEAAVQKRLDEISGAARSMTLSDDLEKKPAERVNIFFEYVKKKKESNALTGPDNEKEIIGEAERLDIKDKAPLVLAELLYDGDMLQQIKTFRNLLLRFTYENDKAQKYLLGGFEMSINVNKEVLLPRVPHILKQFYDQDLLDEEVLLDWDKKSSKKYVSKEVSKEIHTKAAPFVDWLRKAEEESSEEEEEEEDVEVVYSHTEKIGVKAVEKPKHEQRQEASDGEDLDIDDI